MAMWKQLIIGIKTCQTLSFLQDTINQKKTSVCSSRRKMVIWLVALLQLMTVCLLPQMMEHGFRSR